MFIIFIQVKLFFRKALKKISDDFQNSFIVAREIVSQLFERTNRKKIRRKWRKIFTEAIQVKKNASFYVTKFLPILPFDVSLGKNYVKI